jgi:hypothetical protein
MGSLLNEAELTRSREAALRARLDAPPAESWRPEKDPEQPRELVGVFVRREKGQDRGYGEGECAVLRESSGQEWRVWLRTASRAQFERLAIAEGDLVAIRYEGFEPPRGDKPGYHRTNVAVDKGSPEPAPPAAEALVCEQCGYPEPEHAAGCLPY